MARPTIAALQAQIAEVIVQRDEALDALHRLRDEVLAARLAEHQVMYAERPSRNVLDVEERRFVKQGRHFIKTRARGTTVWTVREVQ